MDIQALLKDGLDVEARALRTGARNERLRILAALTRAGVVLPAELADQLMREE